MDAPLAELAQLGRDTLEEMADTVAGHCGLRKVIETEARLYLDSFK